MHEAHTTRVAESIGQIPALYDDMARGMYDSPPYIIYHGPRFRAAHSILIPPRG